ncbi:hypothetical protein KY312_02040 [Candidatus Woesearchaeota archaeon]|nr:hypothetical protein [Candidatus Woesearchaeota archaeon]
MEINGTSFGQVIIDLKKYDYDVWIFPDATIKRRTSDHNFTREEFELLAKKEPETIIIGTGQSGCVKVGEEARRAAREKNIHLMIAKTPDAIKIFNQIK